MMRKLDWRGGSAPAYVETLMFKDDRYGVGRSLGLRFKKLLDTQILRIVGLGIVPLHEQLLSFCFALRMVSPKAVAQD